jgi:hypothetical protein
LEFELPYFSKMGHTAVVFIVDADASLQEAKHTFDRLQMWFPAKSKPSGIDDSAYIDNSGAIHVFERSILLFDRSRKQGQLKNLAVTLATHI